MKYLLINCNGKPNAMIKLKAIAKLNATDKPNAKKNKKVKVFACIYAANRFIQCMKIKIFYFQ